MNTPVRPPLTPQEVESLRARVEQVCAQRGITPPPDVTPTGIVWTVPAGTQLGVRECPQEGRS